MEVLTPQLNRRNVIIGQACAIGFIGSTAVASATSLPYDLQSAPTWETVTYNEMTAFRLQRFWGRGDDGTSFAMRLLRTEAINSGPARPKHLKRKEGVIALFGSPQMDWFIKKGAQNILVGHKVLGHATLYITPSPRRKSGYFLEAVLN